MTRGASENFPRYTDENYVRYGSRYTVIWVCRCQNNSRRADRRERCVSRASPRVPSRSRTVSRRRRKDVTLGRALVRSSCNLSLLLVKFTAYTCSRMSARSRPFRMYVSGTLARYTPFATCSNLARSQSEEAPNREESPSREPRRINNRYKPHYSCQHILLRITVTGNNAAVCAPLAKRVRWIVSTLVAAVHAPP